MYILIGLSVVALFAIFFVSTYKVVHPNEAHIIVFMGRGRKIYSPQFKDGQKSKTSYFFVPLLMKRFVLPLTNVKMDIPNIHLNDVKVAPFICDVITWLHISDPIQAAERLSLNEPFVSLREDLVNIVQAVARAVAMKQEVLEIMKDRKTFSASVSEEVGSVLSSWGVELINLEVNDIRDDDTKGSTVISNYEKIREVEVSSKARQEISIKEREATVVEQENLKMSELSKAESVEAFTKRQIEKDKNIGIATQGKEMEIAKATEITNKQIVSANRTLVVGNADVEKDATIAKASGTAEAVRITGEKESDVIKLKGGAEASAIEARGLAEATAKDKMADALKKFNDAAVALERIRAWTEVEKVKYESLGNALSKADLKLVQSGKGGSIFGFPLNAETGADIGQMLEAIGKDNKKADDVKSVITDVIEKLSK